MAKLKKQEITDPVSAHVEADFTTLRASQSIHEAMQSLRGSNLGEKIIYFYVLDDDGHLVGVVPTRRLLMEMPDVTIESIMIKNVVSIPASMTVLEACEFFVMYKLLAFPVVDETNRLIGVIDVSLFTNEIFGVTERRNAENVFQLIGVQMDTLKRHSPLSGFRRRFPWLLCNIAGGIGCAFIAGMYQQFLGEQIILALFIPVVLTLSEGVSMQSMAIAVQNLREGGIAWRRIIASLRTELLTAVMLGVACGGVVGLIAYAWKHNGSVAIAILTSISLAITTACLLGVVLPVIVRLLKGDPRIAAGPVVLACADVATLLFYFNLAERLLTK